MRKLYSVKYNGRADLFDDSFINKDAEVDTDDMNILFDDFIKSDYDIVVNNLMALAPREGKIYLYALSRGAKVLYAKFTKDDVEFTDVGKHYIKDFEAFKKESMPEICYAIYLIYKIVNNENSKDLKAIQSKLNIKYKIKGSKVKVVKYEATDNIDYIVSKDDSKNSVTFTANNYIKDTYTVPSTLYPLPNKNEVKVFSKDNTSELIYEDINKVLTGLDLLPGRCYENSERIVGAIDSSNLNYKIDYYTGWIYHTGRLTHHAWVVINDIHVIDASFLKGDTIGMEYINKIATGEVFDIDRDMISDNMVRLLEKDIDFKDKYMFGKVTHNYLYIGVKSNRDEARESVMDIRRKHPDHPSYQGVDKNGENETLRMLYRKVK